MSEEFRKVGLMEGSGEPEDEEIIAWFTAKGKHIPIKKGQSKTEALKEATADSSEKQPQDKAAVHTGVMKKVESYRGKEEGTYDYATGERADLKDGYMVTFHQNEPDEAGHYKSHYGRYTEEEYDRITNEFAEENAADVYIGVFDGEPEISFKVKTKEQAKALAKKYNQDSIWDNNKGKARKNKFYDKMKNPMRGD